MTRVGSVKRLPERFLIVNADDFGLSEGVNRGIIETHECGIVTSASLMVRYPAAKEAAAYARKHQKLSVGLHFEISEWHYRDGRWEAAYEIVPANDVIAVEAELQRQLATFQQLLGRSPSHLDSHQHVHLSEPVRAVLWKYAEELRVPLRGCNPEIHYDGSFYGQTDEGKPFPEGISATHLIDMIKALPVGWTELGCHPGYSHGLDSVYLAEREEEIRVLCDKGIRATLERAQVQLCSFYEAPCSTGIGRSLEGDKTHR